MTPCWLGAWRDPADRPAKRFAVRNGLRVDMNRGTAQGAQGGCGGLRAVELLVVKKPHGRPLQKRACAQAIVPSLRYASVDDVGQRVETLASLTAQSLGEEAGALQFQLPGEASFLKGLGEIRPRLELRQVHPHKRESKE